MSPGGVLKAVFAEIFQRPATAKACYAPILAGSGTPVLEV